MAVSQKKRISNDAYNAKCDRIELKPLLPVGADIRAAAAANGQSVQSYVLQAVRDKMARDGFQIAAEWPCEPVEASHE